MCWVRAVCASCFPCAEQYFAIVKITCCLLHWANRKYVSLAACLTTRMCIYKQDISRSLARCIWKRRWHPDQHVVKLNERDNLKIVQRSRPLGYGSYWWWWEWWCLCCWISLLLLLHGNRMHMYALCARHIIFMGFAAAAVLACGSLWLYQTRVNRFTVALLFFVFATFYFHFISFYRRLGHIDSNK